MSVSMNASLYLSLISLRLSLAMRARIFPISLRSSWRLDPGGSLRTVSSSLAATFSRSCIYVSIQRKLLEPRTKDRRGSCQYLSRPRRAVGTLFGQFGTDGGIPR